MVLLFKPYEHGCSLVSWNRMLVCMCVCVCVHVSVCVCVYVCASKLRALITSGVMWCDVSCMWLIKSVLQLFSFLPSINWIGLALVTQCIMQTKRRCQSLHHTSHRRSSINYLVVVTRRSPSVIKVSGRMRSDKFKRSLGFSFTVMILAWNNFLPLLKSFTNKTLSNLNLKI